MQIQIVIPMIEKIGDEYVPHGVGEIVEVTDADAKLFIAEGTAVAVEEVKPKAKKVVV
jgi:hypothetical protein